MIGKLKDFTVFFELFSTNPYSRDNLAYDVTLDEIQNIYYGDIYPKFKCEILECEIENPIYLKMNLF